MDTGRDEIISGQEGVKMLQMTYKELYQIHPELDLVNSDKSPIKEYLKQGYLHIRGVRDVFNTLLVLLAPRDVEHSFCLLFQTY